MSGSSYGFAPNALGSRIAQQTRHALACGAMQPIHTVGMFIEEAGVRFLVRQVSSLARKELDRRRGGASQDPPPDPFLPPEPDLFVADLSPTHSAVLNKFNVIEGHLLVVTRRFEPQEALLNADDCAALALCLAQCEGLGFYNGGSVAGASQAHKHLQWVPLPLAQGGAPVPMEPLFEAVRGRSGICRVPSLPFRHAFSWMEPTSLQGAALLALYDGLLEASGLEAIEVEGEPRQSAPYNLLLTRRWMLLVPRRREHFEAISVNALCFAGSLFVRDDEQLETLRRAGPMRVLQAVAVS